MNRHLHIICRNVPWPANNSRSIDTVEQLKLFHKNGCKIHLHYYCEELNCHPTDLNRFCETIHPYGCKADRIMNENCSSNQQLLNGLQRDEFPILFEGLHCTATIKKLAASGRTIFVRMYDDECRNAAHIAKKETHFIKKMKLKKRSLQIKDYEDELPANIQYIFSNAENARMFREDHALPAVSFVPLLFPFREISSQTGAGNFWLYHGDLSDTYNEKTASWLLEKVFNDIRINFVIAGKAPSVRLKKLGHLYTHTCLIADPSHTEMEDLIGKAHGNIVPSFSYKRPELKLLHALYRGRHCIVNENAVSGTGLEPACYIADTPNALKSAVIELNRRSFEEEEIMLREKLFEQNELNSPEKKLLDLLFT